MFVCENLGLWEDAIGELRKLTDTHPQMPLLRLLLGDIYAQNGNPEDAVRCWKSAMESDGGENCVALSRADNWRVSAAAAPSFLRKATPDFRHLMAVGPACRPPADEPAPRGNGRQKVIGGDLGGLPAAGPQRLVPDCGVKCLMGAAEDFVGRSIKWGNAYPPLSTPRSLPKQARKHPGKPISDNLDRYLWLPMRNPFPCKTLCRLTPGGCCHR